MLTLLLHVLTVLIRHRRIFDDAPRKRSLFLHVTGFLYFLGGASFAQLALHYRRIGVLSLPVEIAVLLLFIAGLIMANSAWGKARSLDSLLNAERNAELSRRLAERWQTLRAQRRSRQQQ